MDEIEFCPKCGGQDFMVLSEDQKEAIAFEYVIESTTKDLLCLGCSFKIHQVLASRNAIQIN